LTLLKLTANSHTRQRVERNCSASQVLDQEDSVLWVYHMEYGQLQVYALALQDIFKDVSTKFNDENIATEIYFDDIMNGSNSIKEQAEVAKQILLKLDEFMMPNDQVTFQGNNYSLKNINFVDYIKGGISKNKQRLKKYWFIKINQ
jgi:hypothetical protein